MVCVEVDAGFTPSRCRASLCRFAPPVPAGLCVWHGQRHRAPRRGRHCGLVLGVGRQAGGAGGARGGGGAHRARRGALPRRALRRLPEGLCPVPARGERRGAVVGRGDGGYGFCGGAGCRQPAARTTRSACLTRPLVPRTRSLPPSCARRCRRTRATSPCARSTWTTLTSAARTPACHKAARCGTPYQLHVISEAAAARGRTTATHTCPPPLLLAAATTTATVTGDLTAPARRRRQRRCAGGGALAVTSDETTRCACSSDPARPRRAPQQHCGACARRAAGRGPASVTRRLSHT